MILGVLSDTHLRTPGGRLEALLAGPLAEAEVLLHAGDYTGDEVLEHLELVDPRPFFGVAGNMDAGGAAGRLPWKRLLQFAGVRVGLVHGWGAPAGLEERVLGSFPEAPDLIVFGHSHRATQKRAGDALLVNPGSAFERRGAPQCTVALVEVGAGPIRVRFREAEG